MSFDRPQKFDFYTERGELNWRALMFVRPEIDYSVAQPGELEVRCCCQPQKLLGFITVEPGATFVQRALIVDPPSGFASMFSVAPVACEKQVRLPVQEIYTDTGRRYRAVKAEGVSLDVLLRVPGFRPANPQPPQAAQTGRMDR